MFRCYSNNVLWTAVVMPTLTLQKSVTMKTWTLCDIIQCRHGPGAHCAPFCTSSAPQRSSITPVRNNHLHHTFLLQRRARRAADRRSSRSVRTPLPLPSIHHKPSSCLDHPQSAVARSTLCKMSAGERSVKLQNNISQSAGRGDAGRTPPSSFLKGAVG